MIVFWIIIIIGLIFIIKWLKQTMKKRLRQQVCAYSAVGAHLAHFAHTAWMMSCRLPLISRHLV